MERIVQRGDRVEVVGGRFKGCSGTIRDPNINQLVRGGPVVASVYRRNGVFLHSVTLENGLTVIIDDDLLFFRSTSLLSPEGFIIAAHYQQGLPTSTTSSARVSYEEPDQVDSSSPRPRSPHMLPSDRANRAARRAFTLPESSG
jgi:hypothetical protein